MTTVDDVLGWFTVLLFTVSIVCFADTDNLYYLMCILLLPE